MIRSGSMLMATALQRNIFSKSFKFDPTWCCFCPKVVWFSSLFSEEMHPNSRHLHPFSIQHLMECGEMYGKKQGQWFAPSTIARVYTDLISKYAERQLGISVYLCETGLNTIFVV